VSVYNEVKVIVYLMVLKCNYDYVSTFYKYTSFIQKEECIESFINCVFLIQGYALRLTQEFD
jgi:hypothetical protein